MAKQNRKMQTLRIFTNGSRADNAYGLSDEVGRIIKRTDRAKQRAEASTARRGASIANRAIRAEFNIPLKEISRKIYMKSTGDALRLYAWNRPISLLAFGGKWKGRRSAGASAQVLRGGSAETFGGSFIIESMKAKASLKRAIRVRSMRGGKRAGRGPLVMLYGPSPRDMITGRRKDAETGTPVGQWGTHVREVVTSEVIAYYISELKRLYAVEARRGR